MWKEGIWLDQNQISLYIFYSKLFCRFCSFSILSRENNCGGRILGEKLNFILNGESFSWMSKALLSTQFEFDLCYRLSCPILAISSDWWCHYFWSQLWAQWKGEKELNKSSDSQGRAKLTGPYKDWKTWPWN